MNFSETLEKLGIFNSTLLSVNKTALPRQSGDGKVRDSGGALRSVIQYRGIKNSGRYNLIQQAIRSVNGNQTLVAVKRPREPIMTLIQEGIVQAIAVKALEDNGIRGAVPQVLEIFQYAGEERICMEWIEGISLADFLGRFVAQPHQFQTALLGVLTQLCILLEVLGRVLFLNHRDMKLDNIWIRSARTPISYTLGGLKSGVGPKTFVWDAAFQVVLLDFGFACLGDARRIMRLNLGGVIPDMDACPKEGRDIYHIFCRILEIPEFAEAAGDLREKILGWMEPYQVTDAERTLLDSSEPEFEIPALSPQAFLLWMLASGAGAVVATPDKKSS